MQGSTSLLSECTTSPFQESYSWCYFLFQSDRTLTFELTREDRRPLSISLLPLLAISFLFSPVELRYHCGLRFFCSRILQARLIRFPKYCFLWVRTSDLRNSQGFFSSFWPDQGLEANWGTCTYLCANLSIFCWHLQDVWSFLIWLRDQAASNFPLLSHESSSVWCSMMELFRKWPSSRSRHKRCKWRSPCPWLWQRFLC